MAEWTKATVLKTVGPQGSGGSNPSRSADTSSSAVSSLGSERSLRSLSPPSVGSSLALPYRGSTRRLLRCRTRRHVGEAAHVLRQRHRSIAMAGDQQSVQHEQRLRRVSHGVALLDDGPTARRDEAGSSTRCSRGRACSEACATRARTARRRRSRRRVPIGRGQTDSVRGTEHLAPLRWRRRAIRRRRTRGSTRRRASRHGRRSRQHRCRRRPRLRSRRSPGHVACGGQCCPSMRPRATVRAARTRARGGSEGRAAPARAQWRDRAGWRRRSANVPHVRARTKRLRLAGCTRTRSPSIPSSLTTAETTGIISSSSAAGEEAACSRRPSTAPAS